MCVLPHLLQARGVPWVTGDVEVADGVPASLLQGSSPPLVQLGSIRALLPPEASLPEQHSHFRWERF